MSDADMPTLAVKRNTLMTFDGYGRPERHIAESSWPDSPQGAEDMQMLLRACNSHATLLAEAATHNAAYLSQMREIGELREALRVAEAALADIGDAEGEDRHGNRVDVEWCECRANVALPIVRKALSRGAKP